MRQIYYLSLPYRYVFAIATEDSVYIYDTQNLIPFSYASGIHYSNLSDLSWSADGKILSITSIDGFCSFLMFKDGELGKVYTEPIIETIEKDCINDENIKAKDNFNIKSKLQKQNMTKLALNDITEKIKDSKVLQENKVSNSVISDKNASVEAKNLTTEKSDSKQRASSNAIKRIKLVPL